MTNAVSLAQQASTGVSPGFRNRIINGAMTIDQRNAGASISIPDSNVYPIDRFIFRNATDGTATGQQSSTVPTGGGFVNSVVWTVGTADASLGTSQYARIAQVIEGYNMADLQWGTSSAKTVTISFWVRSSVTGTFSVVLYNAGTTRGFASNYTISAANTWEQKTITVTGCPDGTWGSTNGGGVTVSFGLGAGTDYQIAAGSWVTTSNVPLASTSQTNLMATAGATFYITGVQLEVGSTATSFDYRPYGTELQLCQRYYELAGFGATAIANTATQFASLVQYKVSKRATPTASLTVTSNIRYRQFGTADRDATSASVDNAYYSTEGANVFIGGFSSLPTSSVAAVNYTTSSNTGSLFAFSAEL